ncbi:thioesterase family protein|uniref:thioesterase family protein n=1 Tax=Stenotrophomonas sp. SbOxS2 TaxID=2723885 RepID=UPI0015D32F3E|nr:thioesterase family protein [Stenotrophomonas sp. SbOxS2]NYT99406.1 thioesterase family protein [Stenotrophomonas sp. SbOxS2]
MTSSLVDIVGALTATGASIPASWYQGRTVFGGLSAALSLAHAKALLSREAPALRAGQISFIGPVAGELSLTSTVLREGRSMTTVGTDLSSGEGLGVRSVFFFGEGRDSVIEHDAAVSPPAKSWVHYPLLVDKSMAPVFLQNFDIRPAGGAAPFSGSDNPEIVWWVKHQNSNGLDPVVALIALGDALPPAAVTSLNRPAPVSSVNWFFDIASAPGGEWFLLRSFSEKAAHGYSIQQMDVWDESGKRVMTGRQTVAVFA